MNKEASIFRRLNSRLESVQRVNKEVHRKGCESPSLHPHPHLRQSGVVLWYLEAWCAQSRYPKPHFLVACYTQSRTQICAELLGREGQTHFAMCMDSSFTSMLPVIKGGGGDVTRRRNYPPSPQFPHRQRCIMALTTIGRLPFSLFLMILWIMLSPVCDRTTLTTNMDHFRPFDVPNDASRAAVISENKHTSIMGEDAIHQLEELENLYRSTLLLRRVLVLYNTTAFLSFFNHSKVEATQVICNLGGGENLFLD
jgi:hypothetical protein